MSYNGHRHWQPGQALCAVHDACDEQGNAAPHDAPQLGCDCGVWAFRDRERLERELRPMRGWISHNPGPEVAYATGQVSLWERVLEFEKGYRAERAYPYALTVFSPDRATAAAIAATYGVDVEWERLEPSAEEPDDPQEDEEETEAGATADPDPVQLDLTESEVLEALFVALAQWTRDSYAPVVDSDDVACAVRFRRGERQPQPVRSRQRRSDLLQVVNKLKRLEADGLAEKCRYRDYSSLYWLLTAEGVAALRQRKRTQTWKWGPGNSQCEMEPRFVATESVLAAFAKPRHPTQRSITEDRPGWASERKAAAARGRRRYRAWLKERRANSGPVLRLVFDDDEVLAALSSRRAMTVPELLQQLAPGKPRRDEIGRLNYQLGQLSKAGSVIVDRRGRLNTYRR